MSPRQRCVRGVEGTRPRMAVAGGLVGKGGRARDGRRRGAGPVPGGSRGTEEGQALVLLIGLVVLVLMVLALGWDTSNWFLGHRALGNLADGAAVKPSTVIVISRKTCAMGQPLTGTCRSSGPLPAPA